MAPDCEPLSGPARIKALRRRAREERIPLKVTLALTHRCNLRCLHCYVLPNARSPELELSSGDWLALAQEAAEAGCFSMLLTGGEPLLRRDFADIYLGIRQMGIHVTLFTNATLVDELTIETLCAAPPRLIEVTVYGATPETYRRVTGRASAYAEAMRGIGLLRAAGLRVGLKTILMTCNQHEFLAIRAMAAAGEPNVRYDPAVHPRFPGDKEVDHLRLPPAEVADLEFCHVSDLPRQLLLQKAREATIKPSDSKPLYRCGAGLTSCYVTAEGMVQPCTSTTRYGVPYASGGLRAAFREGRRALEARHAPAGFLCASCADRPICNSCPPLAEMDCGDEAGRFAYACSLAKERSRRLAEVEEREKNAK